MARIFYARSCSSKSNHTDLDWSHIFNVFDSRNNLTIAKRKLTLAATLPGCPRVIGDAMPQNTAENYYCMLSVKSPARELDKGDDAFISIPQECAKYDANLATCANTGLVDFVLDLNYLPSLNTCGHEITGELGTSTRQVYVTT